MFDSPVLGNHTNAFFSMITFKIVHTWPDPHTAAIIPMTTMMIIIIIIIIIHLAGF